MNRSQPLTSPSPRVMLIFPPVWVPMVPHLALPVLTAYLRQKGVDVTPLDANVAFFTEYLLAPSTLASLVERLHRRIEEGDSSGLPRFWTQAAQRELPAWEEDIRGIGEILAGFRDGDRFFSPDSVLKAQDRLHGLMTLATLAQWPGRISFNHYRRGDIWTEEDLLDLCADPDRNVFLPFWRDAVLPQIRQVSPALLGISISSVHQFIAAMTLARLIRKTIPEVHVVVGGKHLLRIQGKLLEYPVYFRSFFHSAVLHEGEVPLLRLLNALRQGGDLGAVPSLIFLDGDRPVATPFADPPPLAELPRPDFSDVAWDSYLVPRRYAPVRMSRGCYWGKCTFCIRYGEDRTDYLSPDAVLDGIADLHQAHGVRDITVNDDCMPPEYWDDLCQGILQRKLDLSMLIWAKPVSGFTRKRLQRMARAGVRQIRWGVESAHPRILKLMRKGTTVKTALRVLGDAHAAGIWNHACIILGFPTETRKEAQATLDFIVENRSVIQSFILYPFTLYENSHIYRHPEEFSIRDVRVEATPFFDRISYKTDRGMNQEEIQALFRESKDRLLDRAYGWPFWYYLKLREYLQLYLDRFGLQGTLSLPFRREGLRRSWEGLGP